MTQAGRRRLRIVTDWRNLPADATGASVAMGNFDGVHLGHRQVIADAARAARSLDAPLGVVTFEPHPRRWFQPDAPPFRLMTPNQQARTLEGLGVDVLYRLPFDATLASMNDAEFAEAVLARGIGARHVTAGFDIAFGKGRAGTPERLQALGAELGFGVTISAPVTHASGEKCSSTAIREAIEQGRPEEAARLLGRPFTIEGVVIHGDKIGRTIGFPTANIQFSDFVRPAEGIYAARTRLPDGREIPSVAYVGARPTVNGIDKRLEVNLFDFDEDLYGQLLDVELTAFIRGDQKFDGLEAMTEQIARDCQRAREILLPEW
jgi:riboflavin kinase / FMN adenylyltransferase